MRNEPMGEGFRMMRLMILGAAFLALAACGRAQPRDNANGNGSLLIPKEAQPAAPPPPTPHPPPLPEPKGPIDPKSIEAAGQVVQHYGALIEQGRWAESWTLWSTPDTARQFDRNWRNDSDVHLEIGKPGEAQGAAGSIYTNWPVVFYGTSKTGQSFRRAASVVLRRANDVPGSTEAQRRWHIERVEWRDGA